MEDIIEYPERFLERSKKILTLATPIMLGMVGQTLMNLADTLMLGRLGPEALAASAYGGRFSFLVISFMLGLGSALQTISSHRMGAGKSREAGFVLSEALIISLFFGIPLAGLGYYFSSTLIALLAESKTVAGLAIPYLEYMCLAWPAAMINFSFRGYYNGTNRPEEYLRITLAIQAANIFFNFIFIFGLFGIPAMGVTGAGLGTFLATLCGTLLFFFRVNRDRIRFGAYSRYPDPGERKTALLGLFKLALPAGLRGLAVSSGIFIFFIIAGKVGVVELAASNILLSLASLYFMPGNGIGFTAAILLGNALGAKKFERAYNWGLQTALLGGLLMLLPGLLFVVAPRWVVSLFTNRIDIIIISYPILRILGAGAALDVIGSVLGHALIGAGAARSVFAWNLFTMCGVMLSGAYFWGYLGGGGLLGLWLSIAFARLIMVVAMSVVFLRKRWFRLKV